MASPENNIYKIGYALSSKKQKALITPSLLSLASSRGIHLTPINPSLPIFSQFDLILHKLYHQSWVTNLEDFSSENPGVPIIDLPQLIERLHDRVSMLLFVSQLRIPSNVEVSDFPAENHHSCTFGVPKQITIHNASSPSDPSTLSDINFPAILKPLVADGSTTSHKMALVFNYNGLLNQEPPFIIQEFVNHGGVVFKVYVVGDFVTCVKRKSLPDVTDEKLMEFAELGFVSFSQISNVMVMHLEEIEMPPTGFVEEIARGLRNAVGLNLFNFDMIKDVKVGNHFLVIDINYFPGYEKLPGYETILMDFIWSKVYKENEGISLVGDGEEKSKPLCNSCCSSEEVEENET